MAVTSTVILFGIVLFGLGQRVTCYEKCYVSGGYEYYCTGSKWCCGTQSCCYYSYSSGGSSSGSSYSSSSSSTGTSYSGGAIAGFVFAGLFGLVLLVGLCSLAASGCSKLKEKMQERSRRSAVVNVSPASNNNGASVV